MRASFSSEREILLASSRNLAIEIGKLRLQFLDARMAVEQRRRLLGKLRAQRHALFGQPADQFGIEHFGSLDRLAALKHFADQPRLGLGIRLQRARVVQLRVDLAHLLVGQRGVVGADEQARLGAEILDARFGFRDLLAQVLDFARQPLARGLGLLLPRILLQHQIAFGDRVGDARGKFGIARLEFDDDDARFVDRIGGEAVVIGIQHALFRRQRERIAADAEQRQQRFQRRNALQHRIEFRPLGELVLLDDLARQIARQQQLHLAGDGFGVERAALLVALAVRPQEHVLAPVDQDARFGLVARRDQVDGGERQHERQHRRNDDPAPLAHQRLAERMQIEIAGSEARRRSAGSEPAQALRRARCTTALSLPARQNAKRIAHSRGRNCSTRTRPITLH